MINRAEQEWANGLGYDIGDAEVWKHERQFRVFTPERVMLVPYSVTRDPVTALAICERDGLLRDELESMDYRDAEQLFRANVPRQMEMGLAI